MTGSIFSGLMVETPRYCVDCGELAYLDQNGLCTDCWADDSLGEEDSHEGQEPRC